jgi:hypothetical protein
MMADSVERSSLNLRYEGHRLRDDAREAQLMGWIASRGIEEPLEGVDTPEGRFLLNGFKRYRCAAKLGIDWVPFISLGEEEATGIVNLMRVSTNKALGILEQARFIADLLSIHHMTVTEVAQKLSRSKGWVSMRQRLLEEIRPSIQQMLFEGKFPVYSYMYTLRPFMRMNAVKREQVERFVRAVAGKGLSVRDIELLADAYFKGPASLRDAIDQGRLGWSLEQMKNVPQDEEGCSEFERVLLKDLESLRKLLPRIMAKCNREELTSRGFFAQANLLVGSLLSAWEAFHKTMKEFYDRSGQA